MQLYRLEVLETWRRVAYVRAEDVEEARLFAEGKDDHVARWRGAEFVRLPVDAEDYIRVIPVEEEEPDPWESDDDELVELSDDDVSPLDLASGFEPEEDAAIALCPSAERLLERLADNNSVLNSQKRRIQSYILTEARDRPAEYYDRCDAALTLVVTMSCVMEKYEDFTEWRAKVIDHICSDEGPNYFKTVGSR